MSRPHKQQGATLIEAAIVVVTLGLLVGGMAAGQELISNARVHSLLSQQDSIKAAYFGFQDRFRALPGDYSAASLNIDCMPACSNGDGNGIITGIADTPAAPINEYIAVWEHLSNSGFIPGRYTYGPSTNPSTTPLFMYGQYPTLKYDNVYGGTAAARHNLKTGNQIPSRILADVDRKIDDGYATTGAYRFSAFNPSAPGSVAVVSLGDPGNAGSDPDAPVGAGSCFADAPPYNWATSSQVSNCGAAMLL